MVDVGGTVKIPGLGNQKKGMVLAVGIGGVAIVGIVLWRRHQAASTAASTAADSSTEIDPATGYSYGSPEDAAALAAQTAYTTPADLSSNDGIYSTPTTGTTVNPIASNDQWTQAAELYLTQTVGMDAGTASAALGVYINADDATETQKSIIEQAIAGVGYPPQQGTGGYPPSIKTGTVASAPTAPAKPTAASGFYELLPSGEYFQVTNNVRHPILGATAKALGITTSKTVTKILADSPVMKLPEGAPV